MKAYIYKQVLDTKNITLYVRYVDDILIILDTTKINSHTINTYINNTHNNIKLNPTYEEHNSIEFLDSTILRKQTKLEIDIYRKPTTKDTKIIQSIAKNNNFPQGLLHKLNQQIQHNTRCTQTKGKDKKFWTTFMYHSSKIRKITNLFKNTNIGITFKTTTSLHQLIKYKN